VSREPVLLEPELFTWLVRADGEPVRGWDPDVPPADSRCSPELVRRLAEVARPVGAVGRRFVAGRPVIHHPNGSAIAVADGTAWMAVRSGLPAGALVSSDPHLPDLSEYGWVELDAWGPDIAFARVVDLLRAHVARAYALAEAAA
jgi:hypothetical protein